MTAADQTSRSVDLRRATWLARAVGVLHPGARRPPHLPATAAGYRVYAIGDVHGRIDLLRELLLTIELDNSRRIAAESDGGRLPPRRVVTVLVGDLIDRGSGAAALLLALADDTPAGLVCLLGNHEAALVDAYDGDPNALALWLTHGGNETLLGFEADPVVLAEACGTALLAFVREHVPEHCIAWLRSLPLTYTNGDYLFVHAGVRPGQPLARQRRHDLLWIRDAFLLDTRWHGKMIVHGHTATEDVDIRTNRIGIDTGAFTTGRLSAVGLEGGECWVLQTGGPPQ